MEKVLTSSEFKRYNRHLILEQVGPAGQEKLKQSHVLLLGAGGLGSPAALYLVAAGIGKLTIIDFDTVDETNLQRQVLYTSSDVGKKKIAVATRRLLDLNPYVEIISFEERFSVENARKILSSVDLVVDGSDNFPTRYLLNDACVLSQKPFIHGSIFKFEGLLSVFNYQSGPCYRCLYPEPPSPDSVPSCNEAGVLGVLPGVIGSLQATEAVKLILGIGRVASGRVISYDALQLKFRDFTVARDPGCPACGDNPKLRELRELSEYCLPGNTHLAKEVSMSDNPSNEFEIDVESYKKLRDAGTKHILLDVREEYETDISSIDDSVLIPLGELESKLETLDQNAYYIVYCRSGNRSDTAVKMMREHGIEHVKNLVGGINEWAEKIDITLPMY